MRLDLCLPEFTSQSSMHITHNTILYGTVNGLRVAEYKPFSVSTFAPFFARLKFHFHRRMAAVSLSNCVHYYLVHDSNRRLAYCKKSSSALFLFRLAMMLQAT